MRLGIVDQGITILAVLCIGGALGAFVVVKFSASPKSQAPETAPLLAGPEGASEQVVALIQRWDEANDACRRSAAEKMEKGCIARGELDAQLERLGWCFGEGAEAGYLAKWAPCRTDTDSIVDRAMAKMDEPPPPSDPPAVPNDRTWYVVATRLPDCVRTKLAFGVDTPEEVLEEMNAVGNRYSYLRRDDFVVGIIEPLGSPIFFVRGQLECRIARAQVIAE